MRKSNGIGLLIGILSALVSLLFVPATVHAQEVATYTVKPGDTLFSISRAQGVTVTQLRQWNDFDNAAIRAGMVLKLGPTPEFVNEPLTPEPEVEVPISDSDLDSLKLSLPGTVRQLDNGTAAVTLGEGETIYSLSARFGIHPDTLLALNPDLKSFLNPGQEIQVPSDRTATSYRVKPGDTLFGIASKTNSSVAAIRSANSLSGSMIRVGERLSIPAASLPKSAAGIAQLPLVDELAVFLYPNALSGRMLSGGLRYDPAAFMVSHPDLAVGTIVILSREDALDETFAIVVERSLSVDPPLMDVSDAVARALGIEGSGAIVQVRVVH